LKQAAALAALILLGATVAPAQTLSKLGERGYGVVPEPQEVALDAGDVAFGPSFSIERGAGVDSSDASIESLLAHVQERFGFTPAASGGTVVRLAIQPGSVVPGAATSKDRGEIERQAYKLSIGAGKIELTANAPTGLFYAVQTLVQLMRRQEGVVRLPMVRITDWPDLAERHIYWDDAHHLDRLPELKRAIRQAALFKINGFSLKLEGHFQFASAPSIVEPYAMTPAELQELTDYALRLNVQLVPYLDGPAHLAFLLKHPEYAKFRSFPDSNYEICAVNPEAIKLLSGMFQDLVNANRGGRFVYFSTDEPYYIGRASNPQCDEKSALGKSGSVGRLLADFIGKVAQPLHEQGRTVIFWGEYPLKPADIATLPPYLVNGEAYGPEYDPLFRQRGIRQMIYTSTQGEERMFPEYFPAPASRLLHGGAPRADRMVDGFREISYNAARQNADLIGSVVAAWSDAGLHTETFWLGYAMATSAGWRPGVPRREEAAATFYRVFYGDSAENMNRVYQLMSQQARFWSDSWEWGPSKRKPLFGDSARVFTPRQPVQDQTLALPPAPTAALLFDPAWSKTNARRLELASAYLADNDELLALLHDNASRVTLNRYNLEVFISVAQLYRQNLSLLLDIGRINGLLKSASDARTQPKDAVATLDRALALARQVRQHRNVALRDVTETWEKSWWPRVASANGRTFLNELDDVKDHVPGRTVDLSYLVQRQLDLPFGAWVEAIRNARNAFAAQHALSADKTRFDWLDMGDHPVIPQREE
jgi:hypothetical protein